MKRVLRANVLRVASLAALLSILAGCATDNPNIKEPSRTTQIKLGETTKAEVQAILGKPFHATKMTVLGQPQEMWLYTCRKNSSYYLNTVTTFILPIVVGAAAGATAGLAGAPLEIAAAAAAGAATSAPSVESSGRDRYHFMVTFGPDGIVQSISETTPPQ